MPGSAAQSVACFRRAFRQIEYRLYKWAERTGRTERTERTLAFLLVFGNGLTGVKDRCGKRVARPFGYLREGAKYKLVL